MASEAEPRNHDPAGARRRASREASSPRWLPRLLLLGYLACWIWSLRSLMRYFEQHIGAEADLVPGSETLLGAGLLIFRIGLLAVSGYAGIRLARLGLPTNELPRAFRTLSYCALAALIVTSLSVPGLVPSSPRWAPQSIFMASLNAAQTIWALRWIRRIRTPSKKAHSAFVDLADIACGNLLVLLVLLETALAVWGSFRPSPLVFHESVAASLAAHRQAGHRPFHDGQLNSGGFADENFFVASPDDVVIAVLGDSFGLGVVPIPDNYISVAEDALRATHGASPGRLALHNLGVPAIGLPEYAELLRSEAMRWRPSVVVLSVFVGNDLHAGLSFTRRKSRRYHLQQWLLWRAADRAITLLVQSPEDVAAVARIGREIEEDPPTASQPSTAQDEAPTFSESRFLEIERDRLVITQPEHPAAVSGYAAFFAGLDYFERTLGEALVIAIIPDEFQVNDALWQSLVGESDSHDRDLPQRRILEFCRERSLDCIDFLPALRAAEATGPTYHLRDTHWNRWGNRVAGLELARGLGDRVRRGGE